jgi:hypothetical protein
VAQDDVALIIQVPAGSLLDTQLSKLPPPSAADRRVVIEPVQPGADGRIEAPEAGRVVLSFLSPEDLRRESDQINREFSLNIGSEPPVVVIQVAEELREDQLVILLQAAEQAKRPVILCVLQGTS